jgi:hypothetical protein
MARSPLFLGGLLGLPLASGLTGLAISMPPDHGPVYRVAQLASGLHRDPEAWLGRRIMVRGWIEGCPYRRPGPCASWQPLLHDVTTRPTAAGAGLPLVPVSTDPDALTALLRRIQWVRALVPAPQAVLWGTAATYQVELRAVTAGRCGGVPCYEALLLDAAPGSP